MIKYMLVIAVLTICSDANAIQIIQEYGRNTNHQERNRIDQYNMQQEQQEMMRQQLRIQQQILQLKQQQMRGW